MARENIPSQRQSSGIIVLRITSRFTLTPHQIVQKEEYISIFPTFMHGKYSQDSVFHPAEKLNTPGRIGKSPREYSHTHMGVHEDI